MFPLDSETGKPWSASSIAMLTERFKSEADAELRKRDAERSGGEISAKNGYKVYMPDDNGRYVVDQRLRQLRHTGRERRLLHNRKMAEFCLEPKSEAEFIKTHVLGDKRRRDLQRWIDEPVVPARRESELPQAPRNEFEIEPPPKRRRGRPRREAVLT